MKYAKGIMWLDDCRIPYLNGVENEFSETYLKSGNSKSKGDDLVFNISGNKREGVYVNDKGRFTPNLLVCDDMLNDGIKPNKGHRAKGKVSGYGEFGGGKSEYHGIGEYMEVDSKSRYYDLDKWFDKVIDNL
jgi:hypothetical protein